ncbi:uncharacterized protein LOC141904711 [Tubulanus polymorphus]|uniref:uncharacterized protein LOC141904711 n=1 Tax=Tubulanus polymorphus TaxID=672921 RepID=UPI003DA3DB50
MIRLVIFAVTIAFVVSFDDFTAEQKRALAQAKENNLPHPIREMLSRNRRQFGIKHFCCMTDIDEKEIDVDQFTKAVAEYKQVSEKVKVGYTNCKWLGTGRCSQYSIRYRADLMYRPETILRPIMGVCPEKQIQCCSGFINVAGQCLAREGMDKDFLEIIKDLSSSGLLGFQK